MAAGRLLKLRVVVEDDAGAASTPVGLVVLGGRDKAGTSRRDRVARGVEVCGVLPIRLSAVSPASHLHGKVLLGNELGVEAMNQTEIKIDLKRSGMVA